MQHVIEHSLIGLNYIGHLSLLWGTGLDSEISLLWGTGLDSEIQ